MATKDQPLHKKAAIGRECSQCHRKGAIRKKQEGEEWFWVCDPADGGCGFTCRMRIKEKAPITDVIQENVDFVPPDIETDAGRTELCKLAVKHLGRIATGRVGKTAGSSVPATQVKAWEIMGKFLDIQTRVTQPVGDEINLGKLRKMTPEQLQALNSQCQEILKAVGNEDGE